MEPGGPVRRAVRNPRDMAPDRGPGHLPPPSPEDGGQAVKRLLPEGRHFSLRGIAVGLLVGLVVCFSNMYFGLQTGWVSTMTMPASLMGFAIFKALRRQLTFPFSPVENVFVQSVAGGMAIMPLGCGFVGVVSVVGRQKKKKKKNACGGCPG